MNGIYCEHHLRTLETANSYFWYCPRFECCMQAVEVCNHIGECCNRLGEFCKHTVEMSSDCAGVKSFELTRTPNLRQIPKDITYYNSSPLSHRNYTMMKNAKNNNRNYRKLFKQQEALQQCHPVKVIFIKASSQPLPISIVLLHYHLLFLDDLIW